MNVTVAALLGLTLAQPPAPEYHPFASRNIKFPINYAAEKAKTIRKVELYACKNGDQVWQLVSVAPPTQDVFLYTAPDDGRYWFHIVTEDLKGVKDPANLTAEPPAMKVLFDTKPPAVVFTNHRRSGEEVTVEWKVDDQFPKDEATRVYFRPASATDGWQEVTLPAGSKTGVRFPAGTPGPVVVKVVATDLVGNTAEGVKEIAAGSPIVQASTSMSPGSPGTAAAIPPPDLTPPPAGVGPVAPTGPVSPVPPPGAAPAHPATPPPAATALQPSSTPAPAAVSPGAGGPVPTFDPRMPAGPHGVGRTTSPGPVVEVSRAQAINSLRFDLNYQVEQRGPSGISRVDLWVTRDEGRSWVWWSQHDGREAALKVNLGTAANTQPEGTYGFRVVPVSGAGLSDATPVAGDAPDLRLVVDVTPPAVRIFPAVSDPAMPDALVIQWEATDRTFGDDPIALEWSEGPTGPWRPVATAGADVVPAGAVAGLTARRLPNAGRYTWRVPTGLPPRVYLKVTARDAAGNTTEQATREPILIDLTKPRAKITGIGTTPVVHP